VQLMGARPACRARRGRAAASGHGAPAAGRAAAQRALGAAAGWPRCWWTTCPRRARPWPTCWASWACAPTWWPRASRRCSGGAAAERAGDPYTLALVDWLMPGLNGLDTVRAARCPPGRGGAGPVCLLVSASADDGLRTEAQALGAPWCWTSRSRTPPCSTACCWW
jgi:CheY-like chemotaxis protein